MSALAKWQMLGQCKRPPLEAQLEGPEVRSVLFGLEGKSSLVIYKLRQPQTDGSQLQLELSVVIQAELISTATKKPNCP